MKNKFFAILLCSAMLLCLASCSSDTSKTESETKASGETESAAAESEATSGDDYLAGHETFIVTSSDLADGVWSDVISNTLRGENVSPALSWEPVDGATTYVIYMVDISTNGFLHWKSSDIAETELPRGWAKAADYVGPYPPEGTTHRYDVYVIALRAPVERLKGALNGTNPKMEEFIKNVDTDADGNTGNIVAYGRLSGTFSA